MPSLLYIEMQLARAKGHQAKQYVYNNIFLRNGGHFVTCMKARLMTTILELF